MTTRHPIELSARWPAKSVDVAEITLRLGDQLLSRVADVENRSIRDFFRASATGVGLWFADNWWRLRWETLNETRDVSADWRLRHEMNSAMGGALWPPVMIYSSVDRVVFAPSMAKRTSNGPQQYIPFEIRVVSGDQYEKEIDDFFEAVIHHCASTEDGTALKTISNQLRAERANQELAGWRRLEACLGYDADEAPEEVVQGLVSLEEVVGEDGVEEAARAQPGASSPAILSRVIEATKASHVEVDLRGAQRLGQDLAGSRLSSPWQLAEKAAADLRSVIGVRPGQFRSGDLADLLEARWSDLKSATATARDLPYAARLEKSGDRASLSLKTLQARDRRFELARIFADAVWQSNDNFGVASNSKTDRQKFQRAFANSLLCPFDDLRQQLDVRNLTPDAIESAAKAFYVRPSVVRNQLIYKGYLEYENPNDAAEAQ